MRITPCPKCGRIPKIVECYRTKNGARRRVVFCPNFCSVIGSPNPHFYYSSFIFTGDGDDNTVYKLWNEKVVTSKDA